MLWAAMVGRAAQFWFVRRPLGDVRLLSLALACCALGCADDAYVPIVAAETWPEADALFRSDPRWLGGDGALSIALGGDRVLWLFGDSFVAMGANSDRSDSELVRNSIAIQTGLDPLSASLKYYLPTDSDGSPGAFFANQGDEWHWPGHGVRLGSGPLIVFLAALRPTSEGLGFAEAGYRVVKIDDPDVDPLAWKLTWFDGPKLAADPGATLGTAVLHDGGYVYAAASGRGSQHTGYIARLAEAELAAGQLDPEWWGGGARGWRTAGQLAGAPPTEVMNDIGSECSLHFEPRVASYLHVASRGFGSTTIAVRASHGLTGTWSPPEDVFTPPESRGAAPFVYAAKAHPELTTGNNDELVVTYATNSFEFSDLFTPEGQNELYWPRFVRLTLAR